MKLRNFNQIAHQENRIIFYTVLVKGLCVVFFVIIA